MGGFALLAWFNRYVMGIPDKSNPLSWIPTFQITTACALTSMISLVTYVLLDNNHMTNPTGTTLNQENEQEQQERKS